MRICRLADVPLKGGKGGRADHKEVQTDAKAKKEAEAREVREAYLTKVCKEIVEGICTINGAKAHYRLGEDTIKAHAKKIGIDLPRLDRGGHKKDQQELPAKVSPAEAFIPPAPVAEPEPVVDPPRLRDDPDERLHAAIRAIWKSKLQEAESLMGWEGTDLGTFIARHTNRFAELRKMVDPAEVAEFIERYRGTWVTTNIRRVAAVPPSKEGAALKSAESEAMSGQRVA